MPAAKSCGVGACPRGRGRRRYCRAHWERFLDLRDGASFDEGAWQETEPAIEDAGHVSLHGLTERAAAEVLFGLQQRTRSGTTTDGRVAGRVRLFSAEHCLDSTR